jgi:hypothetical protein
LDFSVSLVEALAIIAAVAVVLTCWMLKSCWDESPTVLNEEEISPATSHRMACSNDLTIDFADGGDRPSTVRQRR